MPVNHGTRLDNEDGDNQPEDVAEVIPPNLSISLPRGLALLPVNKGRGERYQRCQKDADR
jgi:hypothetical protein